MGTSAGSEQVEKRLNRYKGSMRPPESRKAMNCVPGGWLPPLLMTVFLLVANILLINMLIAIFNNIFNDTNVRSKEVWLFQRYGQIMEYNDTPLLPPPFTILAHLAALIVRCCGDRLPQKKHQNEAVLDFSMKLNLRPEELRDLHDFEEDCMDELTRKRQSRVKGTTEERFSQAIEQSDLMTQRMNDLLLENFSLKNRICDMESGFKWIMRTQKEMLDLMQEKKKLKTRTSSRGSSQSLPEAIECSNTSTRKPREVTSITDNILLLAPPEEDRKLALSPILSHLRRDHILRKYDEARYQSPLARRRQRLHSSSQSISQDMREMDNSSRHHYAMSSDEETPEVVVDEYQDS